MKPRRVPKKKLSAYLISSLGYSGSDRWSDFTLLKRGFQCYQVAVGAGLSHLPLSLAVDLRLLAEYGNEFTFAGQKTPGVSLQVRSLYENQILNRLLREFCVQQALELLSYFRFRAMEAVEGGDGQAVDHEFAPRADRLTQILLQRLAPHWPKAWIVNAAHLRGVSLDVPEQAQLMAEAARWAEVTADGPGFEALLEDFVHSATGAEAGVPPVTWSSIIKAEDLFEIEHLPALNREYLRIQVRELIDVRESLPVLDPHDIQLMEENSEVETLFMDQSHYPTGGFSEVTNRGSFENLVLSELIYMGRGATIEDEPDPSEGRRALDLFDLRFVEGELLYYLRDSGQLQRKRRKLNLVLDLKRPLNIKYPEHPYQLETLVVGLILALERDINILFSTDAVSYSIHLVAGVENSTDEFPEHVVKLKEVLDILFEASIQRDLMSIHIREEIPWAEMALSNRKSYCVGFSSDPRTVRAWGRKLVEQRQELPPLFGLMVNLAEGEKPVDIDGLLVIHLNLARSSLEQLKLAILEAILLSSAPVGSLPSKRTA